MTDAPRHYVNPEPFVPQAAEVLSAERERFYTAPQWRLIWWRFRRHRLAVVSTAILAVFYLIVVPFAELVAPYDLLTRDSDHINAPPQTIHFFHDGAFVGPFVYGYDYVLDRDTFRRNFTENRDKVQPLRFFCSGDGYRFWGLFEADFHFVCPAEHGKFFLLGTDGLGRDMFSRIVHGARISLTIGLIGLVISFILGVTLGGIAGWFGGIVDNLIDRLIELLRSLPELPLWLALAAALPVTWSPVLIYFGITLILGLLDWPGLARAVRAKVLSLREEDFAVAATLMGASPKRVIFRHMLPNFSSHLIASATLSIPSMILGETALSFLGLGLREPITSWGVLLYDAQDLSAIEVYPWLLAPVVPVVLVVLAFNFFGDGLRDAADPYKTI